MEENLNKYQTPQTSWEVAAQEGDESIPPMRTVEGHRESFLPPLRVAFQKIADAHFGKPRSLIDFGVGTGDHYTLWGLPRRIRSFHLVDINPAYLGLAVKRFKPNLAKPIDHDLTKPLMVEKTFNLGFAVSSLDCVYPVHFRTIAQSISGATNKFICIQDLGLNTEIWSYKGDPSGQSVGTEVGIDTWDQASLALAEQFMSENNIIYNPDNLLETIDTAQAFFEKYHGVQLPCKISEFLERNNINIQAKKTTNETPQVSSVLVLLNVLKQYLVDYANSDDKIQYAQVRFTRSTITLIRESIPLALHFFMLSHYLSQFGFVVQEWRSCAIGNRSVTEQELNTLIRTSNAYMNLGNITRNISTDEASINKAGHALISGSMPLLMHPTEEQRAVKIHYLVATKPN